MFPTFFQTLLLLYQLNFSYPSTFISGFSSVCRSSTSLIRILCNTRIMQSSLPSHYILTLTPPMSCLSPVLHCSSATNSTLKVLSGSSPVIFLPIYLTFLQLSYPVISCFYRAIKCFTSPCSEILFVNFLHHIRYWWQFPLPFSSEPKSFFYILILKQKD